MDPMSIGLIAQGAGNIMKTGLGFAQLLRGAFMKVKRPEYTIPDAVQENVALRRAQLFGGLAGASQYRNQILQNQANFNTNLRQGSTDSSTYLSALAMGQGNTNRSFQDLQRMEAEDYQRRLSGLEQANNTLGQYQDKAWQYNKYEPYMNKAQTKSALIGGGLQNIFGGLGDTANTMGQAYQMQQVNPSFFSNMLGSNNQQYTPSRVPMNGFYDAYRGF